MNEPRLEARLVDWYAQPGVTVAPEPLREAVLGIPDLHDGVIALRRPVQRVWGPRSTTSGRRIAIAAAAVVVVAVLAIDLLSNGGVVGGPTASSSPLPSASSRSASPSPVGSPGPNAGLLKLDPGPFDIRWPGSTIHLKVPDGWASAVSLTAICQLDPPDTLPGDRSPDDCSDGNRPNLRIHDVTGVATDTCPATPGTFVEVGPTVDFTKALRDQVGPVRRSGPNYIKLGGFPAERFNLTYDFSYPCPAGPEGREVWIDRDGSQFTQFKDGTGTVYVVDVDGDRVVMTTHYRGASAADIAELDAIVASIQIRPMAAELPGGGLSVQVGSVAFTVGSSATLADWGRFGNISVNNSIAGPQGAEAIVYWTAFPDGGFATACGDLKDVPADASAADLATAVSMAPGIDLITSSADVTVGGRPAKHLVVRVREDLGCDPGYFFTWHDRWGGPMWSATDVGATIGVWIVDVDGTRLFIAGEIARDLGPGDAMTDAQRIELDQEIQQIVDSIKFE